LLGNASNLVQCLSIANDHIAAAYEQWHKARGVAWLDNEKRYYESRREAERIAISRLKSAIKNGSKVLARNIRVFVRQRTTPIIGASHIATPARVI